MKRIVVFLLLLIAVSLLTLGCEIKPEHLRELYANGFECRAWGISDETVMKAAVDMGVNAGMTVNFPDKLVEYMRAGKSE